MTSHNIEQSIGDAIKQNLFGPATTYTAGPLSGISLKDIRDLVQKFAHVPQVEYVRVSDGWWVCLHDGKPVSSHPHSYLMNAIDEVTKAKPETCPPET